MKVEFANSMTGSGYTEIGSLNIALHPCPHCGSSTKILRADNSVTDYFSIEIDCGRCGYTFESVGGSIEEAA